MTTRRAGTLPDAAVEDYLKTIYQHTEWQDELITPSALATKLAVAPASVTSMVKKLSALGLVDHVPYGPLSLTAEGTSRALAVVRRHRLIETWLVRELGYSWDEVHDEAELLEHSMSDRLVEAIDMHLGNPTHDPHGDAIPYAQKEVSARAFETLDKVQPLRSGVVLRVDDKDPDLLRLLALHEVRPGTVVTVTQRMGDILTVTSGCGSGSASGPASGSASEPVTASGPVTESGDVSDSSARPGFGLSVYDAQRIWVRPSSESAVR